MNRPQVDHFPSGDWSSFRAARARRGVLAVHTSWPNFECSPVEAVVFTRSLHHMSGLQNAVDKARAVLSPTGMLLLEDFAFDAADGATVEWFSGVLRSRNARALITPVPGEFITTILGAADLSATWHRSHDSEHHTIAAMTRAIAERFVIRESEEVPYLYRYLVPVLPETPEAHVFVEDVFREETRLGQRGEIVLIGRRIVGLGGSHPDLGDARGGSTKSP